MGDVARKVSPPVLLIAVAAFVMEVLGVPWRAINDVTVAVADVACAVFVVRYHVSTRGAWASSVAGRNVMLLMSTLVAALTMILAVKVWGDFPGRHALAWSVYATILVAAVQRTILQGRVQRAGEAPSDPPRKDAP